MEVGKVRRVDIAVSTFADVFHNIPVDSSSILLCLASLISCWYQ